MLVRKSGRDQCHHFSLARRETLQARRRTRAYVENNERLAELISGGDVGHQPTEQLAEPDHLCWRHHAVGLVMRRRDQRQRCSRVRSSSSGTAASDMPQLRELVSRPSSNLKFASPPLDEEN